MKREIIDRNTAVAKASYKLSEISFIYPITPSSPMAENCDEMRAKGELNIFGNKMETFWLFLRFFEIFKSSQTLIL